MQSSELRSFVRDIETPPVKRVTFNGGHSADSGLHALAAFLTAAYSALPQLLTFAFRDESHHDWMLSQCSHGATMASLNQDVIKRIPILLPSSDLLDRFFEISSDVLRAVRVLQRRNSNLHITRDLLLPKLISGQLDVEDLDIDVGMTAEELAEVAGE